MTTIRMTDAAIGSGFSAEVPALSVTVAPGVVRVLAVQTEERPLLVSMLLGGRIRPDSGSVSIDMVEYFDLLRRRTALVDTPFVAEPSPSTSLELVVAEEFAFSNRAGGRASVRRFLQEHGLAEYQATPVRSLPPAVRVQIFSELALLRDGVDCLVVTSPERHGGEPGEWFDYLASVARRGVSVVIVTDALTRDRLVALGATDAAADAAASSSQESPST